MALADFPEHVQRRVRAILDREARRLLAERQLGRGPAERALDDPADDEAARLVGEPTPDVRAALRARDEEQGPDQDPEEDAA